MAADPVLADVDAAIRASTIPGGTPPAQMPPQRLADDDSAHDEQFSQEKWQRLSAQRDVLISAVIRVFMGLNGGVFVLVLLAWVAGLFTNYRIVDGQTLMALIGATVVQAGLAFAAIVKFLFPADKDSSR